MQQFNMMIAGEFLLMAAYLLEMKSKKLLPEPPTVEEEENLIEVEEELLRRLAEYKVYKNLAESLRERKEVFQRVYTQVLARGSKVRPGVLPGGCLAQRPCGRFQTRLGHGRSQGRDKEIIAESFSVKEKIAEIETAGPGDDRGGIGFHVAVHALRQGGDNSDVPRHP